MRSQVDAITVGDAKFATERPSHGSDENGSDELPCSDMVRMKHGLVGTDALIYKGRPNHTIMVGTKPSGPTVVAVVTASKW